MMIYDDLTIMMYRNTTKNYRNPLPPKASPLHPKLGRHLPYQIEWWCRITVTPCSTHHSNRLLTHTLKIPAKIESPRRSLRSLWGLITAKTTYMTCFLLYTNVVWLDNTFLWITSKQEANLVFFFSLKRVPFVCNRPSNLPLWWLASLLVQFKTSTDQ